MKNMKVNVRMFVTIGLILLLSVITIVVAEVASTITDGNYLQGHERLYPAFECARQYQ